MTGNRFKSDSDGGKIVYNYPLFTGAKFFKKAPEAGKIAY